jgi:DNA-binding SARP family transcriptional activator
MSRLNLYFLGPPRIEYDDQLISVDTRKAIALLAYITVTGESQRRDSLVNLLWPDYGRRRGRTNLRRTLYALRKAINGPWLDADRETIGLHSGAPLWIDVKQFRGNLRECQRHGHPDSEACQECEILLTSAVELCRGDFLAGFSLRDSLNFDDWQFTEAEILRHERIEALDRLVKCLAAQAKLEAALDVARQWVALDRLDESAHCCLIRLYALNGQRSAALRQYEDCVKILETELGAPPQPSTTELYEAALHGRIASPAQRTERATVRNLRVSTDAAVGQPILPRDAYEGVFVAREKEMACLRNHLDAALGGRGRVVLVSGGPGRGKTALIQEFARQAQERSPDLIFAGGHCNAITGYGDPYLPFREILALLTGDVDALWQAGTISQAYARRLWDAFPLVADALLNLGPDLIGTLVPGVALVRRAAAYAAGEMSRAAGWLEHLTELVDRGRPESPSSSPRQSALFEQFTRVVLALAQHRTVMLALDDLQWADAGSIDLLFHLSRRIADSRVLLTVAFRPEEVAQGRVGADIKGRERHILAPLLHEIQRTFGDITIDLAQTEGRPFVTAFVDAEPNRLGRSFRERLYQRTRGHPLYTVEILRGMRERGDLEKDRDGYWVEGPELDWETLPARTEAVIAERIERLDSEAQNVLRIASVEGETFTAEVIAAVQRIDERLAVDRLSHDLELKHRLVRAQEIQRLAARRLSRYRFRHILFQDYVYHSMDAVERAHLHERVGVALEALYGEEAQEIAVALARHFRLAGIVEKEVAHLYQAGSMAARMSAYHDAITHFSRALDALAELSETRENAEQELDLCIAMGVPLVLTRGHAAPEVERVYARARVLSERVGDAPQHFHALLGLRRFALHHDQPQYALQLDEMLLNLAARAEDSPDLDRSLYLSRAHMMHAETLYYLGAFEQAHTISGDGLRSYDPLQRHTHVNIFGNDTGIGCRIYEAITLWHLGYPDQARTKGDEALRLARELAHPFSLAYALYYSATVHLLCGAPKVVQGRVEDLLRISKAQDFALWSAGGTALRGWALFELGEREKGIELLREGVSALRSAGINSELPGAVAFLAAAILKSRDAEAVSTTLPAVQAALSDATVRVYDAELCRLDAELKLLMCERDIRAGKGAPEPEDAFRRALAVAREQGARSWELRIATGMSKLWQLQGKRAAAQDLLTDIYGSFTEGFETRDLQNARTLLGELIS